MHSTHTASIQKKHSAVAHYNRLSTLFIVTLCGWLLSASAYAHRGAVDEIDACNVRVGSDSVHFTAYTPSLTGSKGFCSAIPQIGETHLVFDYGGKELRNISVEFEITKEPEGTRIFYQEPLKIKTGSFNSKVNFAEHGAGNYLAHISIVDNGKQLDSHIPFSVGLEDPDQFDPTPLLVVFGLLGFMVLTFWYVTRNDKNDKSADTPET